MARFSFSRKYNSERLFDIDVTGLQYHELYELFENTDEDTEHVYTVEGIYINTKGRFEDRPCVVCHDDEGFRDYVNLPAHLTEQCREILRDVNAVAAINSGNVGFTIYKYYAKNYDNKECWSIRWKDI